MRLEFNVCTCHTGCHTPSLPAGSQPWGWQCRAGAAAEGRDRPVLAALALLLLPSLRAINQLQPRGQSCVEGVSHASVSLVCWPLASRCALALVSIRRAGAAGAQHPRTHLRSGVGQQQQPWKTRVGVSPAMPPSQRVCEDGSVSAACQRSSAFRELLVFTGVSAHPRSLAPSSWEEGTGRRKRH